MRDDCHAGQVSHSYNNLGKLAGHERETTIVVRTAIKVCTTIRLRHSTFWKASLILLVSEATIGNFRPTIVGQSPNIRVFRFEWLSAPV